jgi:eukaryotic-like serine/threonine-protein kinase
VLMDDDGLTGEHAVLGTPKYLSPEQVQGRAIDGRADLYALGIVLYECLTGRVPFLEQTDAATAVARLKKSPAPVRSLLPGVPRALDELVARLLARDPERRPRRAALVRDELMRLEGALLADDTKLILTHDVSPITPLVDGDATPPAINVPVRPRRSRAWRAALLTVLLVAAGLAAAGAVLSRTGAGDRLLRSVRESVTGRPAAPATTAVAPVTTVTASTVPARIVSTGEFDPDGDGKENPNRLAYLDDGDPTTFWSTVCYDTPTMMPKSGVGVILQISETTAGRSLEIDAVTEQWSADVYVSTSAPLTLAGWGEPVATVERRPAGVTAVSLGDTAATHILVLFTEIGREAACSERYPYQQRIARMAITG